MQIAVDYLLVLILIGFKFFLAYVMWYWYKWSQQKIIDAAEAQ